jgi:hypothetical protein
VEPEAVLCVTGSEERVGDGNLPLGDGAEDRDEVEIPSLYGETVEPDAKEPAGAAVENTLAKATSTAFS